MYSESAKNSASNELSYWWMLIINSRLILEYLDTLLVLLYILSYHQFNRRVCILNQYKILRRMTYISL